MAKIKRTSRAKPARTLRQRAEEMARTSPTDIAGMTSIEVQRLIHELQIHQIELELQNEELRQAQVELAHSRDQYSDLYEFAPTGYVTLDCEGKIQNANLTAATMLGVERQYLLQSRLTKFVSRESQDEFYLHQRSVFSSETKQTCEVRMKGAEAQSLVVRLESSAFGPENDRLCRTALIDLTAERQAQQLLQQSEQRFRRLTDAVTDCIYRVRIEHGRAVETIHGANCQAITGYTPDELAAHRGQWMAMVPPKDRPAVERQGACILSGQDAPAIEHRLRRKDGQIIWVLNVVSPERDAQGQLIAYDGLIRDITKRKVAEKTLRLLNIDLGKSLAHRTGELQKHIKQVKLLTEAVSHLGEGVLITSDELDWPGPHIVFVNKALCQITGYAPEELIGQSPRILQGEGSNGESLDRIKAELSAGHSVLAELINYRKDGTPYDVDLFITPLFNAEGRRTNFVAVHRDITERKRAEKLLLQERNRAQQYLDVSGVIMVALDPQGVITLINRKGCEVLGYDEHELLGKNWFDTCLPEGARIDVRIIFQQIMQGTAADTEYFENSVLTRAGKERIIQWHNSEIRDETGQIVGVLGSGNDITSRRRAERELRNRKQRMQAILNTAADAIITINRRGIIISVNLATEKMFGYTRNELVGQNVKILMPPPYHDEHDGYIRHYLQTADARMIGTGREVVGRRKDGSSFPIGLAISEIDHLGLLTGIIRDISEQRKLQREVVAIADEEQRRIGQDLHDSTQQELTGLGMLAQALLTSLSQNPTDRPTAAVDKCCELAKKIVDGITRTHQEVQSISRGLIPIRLDPEGLMDALRELASRTDQLCGVNCAFKCERPVEVAESFTATHLYRIAQEAVTNALKHAQPEHILIALESDHGHPTLQIADDGTGFNSNEKSAGMGLKTMHYRASLLGADLTISPIDTGGTLVTCKVLSGGDPRGLTNVQ